jgi:hypothetical protein
VITGAFGLRSLRREIPYGEIDRIRFGQTAKARGA